MLIQKAYGVILVSPPCPADDVNHAVVTRVLILQASSDHLVWVCSGHGEDFGQSRHCNVFKWILQREKRMM